MLWIWILNGYSPCEPVVHNSKCKPSRTHISNSALVPAEALGEPHFFWGKGRRSHGSCWTTLTCTTMSFLIHRISIWKAEGKTIRTLLSQVWKSVQLSLHASFLFVISLGMSFNLMKPGSLLDFRVEERLSELLFNTIFATRACDC